MPDLVELSGLDGPGLRFEALAFEQRSRIVRAVIDDADTARWIARTLEADAPPCAELERDADRLAFVARRCPTATGATIDGAFEIFDAKAPTASYQFVQLRITGAGTAETIELDGTVDADRDAHHVDLVVARAGGAVHASISIDATYVIAAGSFVEFDGRRATVTGTLGAASRELAFEGDDRYGFVARGACGRDSRGDEICSLGAPVSTLQRQ